MRILKDVEGNEIGRQMLTQPNPAGGGARNENGELFGASAAPASAPAPNSAPAANTAELWAQAGVDVAPEETNAVPVEAEPPRGVQVDVEEDQ
jgi:hypothetical protein